VNRCKYDALRYINPDRSCVFPASASSRRRRNLRRESQKGFLHANSYSAQKEKIVHHKKRIGITVAECVTEKETCLSIAERFSLAETKKEIFANAGAIRNSIAN
jgi:hypothetical protein